MMMLTTRMGWRIALARTVALASALVVGGGCASTKFTGTSRSGTEELLLTGTWDRALGAIDFRPLMGRKVYLDPSLLDGPDKNWMIVSLRRAMAEQGVLLQPSSDKAEILVEGAAGAYGTDERSCQVGLPNISLMPGLTGLPMPLSSSSGQSPALVRTNRQDAVVKLALTAYDAQTGQLVWDSGTILTSGRLKDRYLSGAGPFRSTNVTELQGYPPRLTTEVKESVNHLGHLGKH